MQHIQRPANHPSLRCWVRGLSARVIDHLLLIALIAAVLITVVTFVGSGTSR